MARTEKKRNPIATILVAIGIIALIGAVGWYAKNLIEDYSAEEESRKIADRLERIIVSNDAADTGDDADSDVNDDYVEPTNDPSLIEMGTATVDGWSYIGVLEIPSASLVLPVNYDWDYTKLAVSPCRYSGSYFTDDMVICAHDYGSHFRAIRSLAIGDAVFFTAIDGERTKYIVTNVETVDPTAVEKMINNKKQDDSGTLWDMTLFTCNIGGQTRCAVRLEREK